MVTPARPPVREFRVSPAVARGFADLARRYGGLDFDASKTHFFETRLLRLMPASGFATPEDLLRAAAQDEAVARRTLEGLTTHTTSFFREPEHYRWLMKTGFARFAARTLTSAEPMTIWSAACSTGAELWSAGMTFMDWCARSGGGPRPFALAGTDISQRILQAAAGATYREEEIDSVGAELRLRYFLRSQSARDSLGRPYWRVARSLRQHATFRHGNLLEADALPPLTADVVFLRNVLIYFSAPDRDRAVGNVVRRMRRGAALLCGHAERIDPSRFGLIPEAPSIFIKAEK